MNTRKIYKFSSTHSLIRQQLPIYALHGSRPVHEPYEKPLAIIWSGTEKELLTEVEVSCSQVIQRIL